MTTKLQFFQQQGNISFCISVHTPL